MYEHFWKRLIDIVLSTIGIIVAGIPMLVVAFIFILLAVVFMIYPPQEGKDKGQTLVAAAGIALIFVGVVNFITTLAISGKIKRWTKTQSGSPKVIDVEYEDVDDENK